MTRKTYTIKVNSKYACELLRELNAWGVRKSNYQVLIVTQDTNVVDVITETFFHRREFLEIKENQP